MAQTGKLKLDPISQTILAFVPRLPTLMILLSSRIKLTVPCNALQFTAIRDLQFAILTYGHRRDSVLMALPVHSANVNLTFVSLTQSSTKGD